MQNIVFLPGIFGTEMIGADGFVLWPPISGPLDTDTRARGILNPTTRPGQLLEKIKLLPTIDVPEYSPITNFLANLPATTLTRFPYDWRVDVRTTAGVLAKALAAMEGTIVLMAHSMGGLVCRYMLECGQYDREPWFGRVQQLVCIATPHLGAPVALFRVLGREGLSGLLFPGPDMGILASRPDVYPAGHQLLPPPSVTCVQTQAGASSIGAAYPAIDPVGIAAGTALYATLGRFQRSGRVPYRFAFGHGYVEGGNPATTVGITLDDRDRSTHVFGEGDGTVPFWSALPSGPAGFLADQFGVVGDHVGILGNATLLKRIEDWVSPHIV